MCYEVAPSFGMQTVEQQFILTPAVQAVKVLVLPSKQKIKVNLFLFSGRKYIFSGRKPSAKNQRSSSAPPTRGS